MVLLQERGRNLRRPTNSNTCPDALIKSQFSSDSRSLAVSTTTTAANLAKVQFYVIMEKWSIALTSRPRLPI